jgi:hypothetical protein
MVEIFDREGMARLSERAETDPPATARRSHCCASVQRMILQPQRPTGLRPTARYARAARSRRGQEADFLPSVQRPTCDSAATMLLPFSAS